eukprot:TRINITY_DN61504_c0_g1_i1.p1 TRINITY_DN61504_c0_g1~~TRINITY_DN61504_c0_g1_i1.p1  ORF type:complete len:359 (+),score=83.94 TRINITY_DN61504_c0_g1_i1:411-1487(+)
MLPPTPRKESVPNAGRERETRVRATGMMVLGGAAMSGQRGPNWQPPGLTPAVREAGCAGGASKRPRDAAAPATNLRIPRGETQQTGESGGDGNDSGGRDLGFGGVRGGNQVEEDDDDDDDGFRSLRREAKKISENRGPGGRGVGDFGAAGAPASLGAGGGGASAAGVGGGCGGGGGFRPMKPTVCSAVGKTLAAPSAVGASSSVGARGGRPSGGGCGGGGGDRLDAVGLVAGRADAINVDPCYFDYGASYRRHVAAAHGADASNKGEGGEGGDGEGSAADGLISGRGKGVESEMGEFLKSLGLSGPVQSYARSFAIQGIEDPASLVLEDESRVSQLAGRAEMECADELMLLDALRNLR